MGIKYINITNQRFGRLVAKRFLYKDKKHQCVWEFICDCGNKTKGVVYRVRNGHKKSCGCLHKEMVSHANYMTKTTHGLSKTRFYKIWDGMNYRCKDKGNIYYGNKNISCEWKHFEDFYNDMYESYLVHCYKHGEKRTSIDRINGKGNYCKENCRWSTPLIQRHNWSVD